MRESQKNAICLALSLALLFVAYLLLSGCGRGGTTHTSYEEAHGPVTIAKSDGVFVDVKEGGTYASSSSDGQQPSNPDGEALSESGPSGSKSRIPGWKESSSLNSFWLIILGYIVMAFGAIIWAAKRAPSITSGYLGLVANTLPKGGGPIIMGVGALMVWGHVLSPIVQMAGFAVAAVVIGKWGFNMYDKKKQYTGDEMDHPTTEALERSK